MCQIPYRLVWAQSDIHFHKKLDGVTTPMVIKAHGPFTQSYSHQPMQKSYGYTLGCPEKKQSFENLYGELAMAVDVPQESPKPLNR